MGSCGTLAHDKIVQMMKLKLRTPRLADLRLSAAILLSFPVHYQIQPAWLNGSFMTTLASFTIPILRWNLLGHMKTFHGGRKGEKGE
jgi:hypothetical protein